MGHRYMYIRIKVTRLLKEIIGVNIYDSELVMAFLDTMWKQ